MDKLLIDQYGTKTLYNTETNSIKTTPSDFDVRCAFFAEQDGQIITETEVVDYNAGDLILYFVHWNGVDYDTKAVICTRIVDKDDISRWFKSLTKKTESNETI